MSPPTTTRFDCPAGLRRDALGTALFVRSPRTGRTIEVRDGWFRELPPRVLGRIAQAVAVGNHTVAFSREELAALAVLAQ